MSCFWLMSDCSPVVFTRSCENMKTEFGEPAWRTFVLFFLYVLDAQHFCCVHKTQRHSPAGHQREGHERLAVRLQPAAGRDDKVSSAQKAALKNRNPINRQPKTKLLCVTDRSWPGDAAECRRTEEAERRGVLPSRRPLNIPSVNTY